VKKDTSQLAWSPDGFRVTTGAVIGILFRATFSPSMYAKLSWKPFCVAPL
jgi:hypothetical protein